MQDNNQQISQQPIQPVDIGSSTSPPGGVDKEKEARQIAEGPLEEIVEPEPSEEVARHLVKTREEIRLPPDLKTMGVSTPAVTKAVSDTATTSPTLPLTDDQIALGLQAQILSSLRWLAEWCLRQLKKAHLHLKKVHGHFLKVKD